MNPALIDALLLASAGWVSVGQILVVLLLLSSDGGLRKASAYAAGMGAALLVIGEATLLIGSQVGTTESDGPGATAWVSLILGALLLAFAVRTWRTPPTDDPPRPKVFEALDGASATRLLGFGAFIGVVNVKNLAIYLTAVDAVRAGQMGLVPSAASVALVTFVFCLYLVGPISVYVVGGARARPALAWLRGALERNYRAVLIGVMTVFGLAFLARGAHLIWG